MDLCYDCFTKALRENITNWTDRDNMRCTYCATKEDRELFEQCASLSHGNHWLICLRCRLNSEHDNKSRYTAIKEALWLARTRHLRDDQGQWRYSICTWDCGGGCGDPDCGNKCSLVKGHHREGSACSCGKISLSRVGGYYGTLPDVCEPPPTQEQSKTLYPVIICPRWNTRVPADHTCAHCQEMPSKRSKRGR